MHRASVGLPFSCIRPTHPWENLRRRGRWEFCNRVLEPNQSDLNESTVGEDFGRAIFRRIIEHSSDEIIYARDLLS
jgi:hypothetical protein